MIARRRAIGEVVAALVLIFIASIAGILLFTVSLRTSSAQAELLRGQLLDEGNSSMERFRVLHAVRSGDTLTLWVYNHGKIDIEVVAVYVNGVRTTLTSGPKLHSVGEIHQYQVNLSSTISGPGYSVSIISGRGVKNVTQWVL